MSARDIARIKMDASPSSSCPLNMTFRQLIPCRDNWYASKHQIVERSCLI